MSVDFNQEYELGDFAHFVTEKINAEEIEQEEYISTENMIVDRGGVEKASKLPSVSKFSRFQETDTLFSNIRTYFRKVWMASFDGGASADVLIFRTKNEQILDPAYLYYLISNKDFADYSVLTAKGVKMPRGDKIAMMQYKFLLHDPEKQKSYATALKSIDDKIENNRKINETLEGVAQAVFKSWFVDFEPTRAKIAALEAGGGEQDAELAAMSAISGKDKAALERMRESSPDTYKDLKSTATLFPARLVESELGQIPEGWEVSPLGEYLTIKRGGSPRPIKDFIVPEGYPWLKIADATAEKSPFIYKTKEFIKEEGLKKTTYLKRGSLILSNSATPGIPKFLEIDSCIHDGWLHFPEIKNLTPEFLFLLFKKIRLELIAQGNGSVFTNLKTDILRGYVTVIPPNELMDIFTMHIQKILETINTTCKQSQTLTLTRDALLPKLLSGEIDVEHKIQGYLLDSHSYYM